MRPAGADGLRHVRQADRSPVAFDEFVRHLAPFRIVRQAQVHRAVELIRIGNAQRPIRAEDGDRLLIGATEFRKTRGEGLNDRADGAAFELHHAADVIRRFDADRRPLLRLAGDGAVRNFDRGHAADALHRSQEIEQRGEIVRPHVEHGPAALLVVELRVGMPVLVPAAHHEGGERDRLADRPVVDHFSRRLNAGAQKGVGGTSHAEVLLSRGAEEHGAFVAIDGQGLFRVGVLARLNGAQADGDVSLGDRQVQNDLDRIVGQQFLNRAYPGDLKLLGLLLRRLQVQIRAGGDANEREIIRHAEVGGADRAGADHADTHSLGFWYLWRRCCWCGWRCWCIWHRCDNLKKRRDARHPRLNRSAPARREGRKSPRE